MRESLSGAVVSQFPLSGAVIFDSGAEVEILAARAHLYNDGRSDAKGSEIEGIEIGNYRGQTFVFIGAERGNFVAVYALGAANQSCGSSRFWRLVIGQKACSRYR